MVLHKGSGIFPAFVTIQKNSSSFKIVRLFVLHETVIIATEVTSLGRNCSVGVYSAPS